MYEKASHAVPVEKLPEPRGYKILIYVPEMKEKSSGGIIIPQNSLDREKTASIVGQVLAIGASAYVDPVKFPSGAYCKEGDWVMFHSYSGTRFKVEGKEFRLINDDTVEAVTGDPGDLERA